jgi:hypothetical protein
MTINSEVFAYQESFGIDFKDYPLCTISFVKCVSKFNLLGYTVARKNDCYLITNHKLDFEAHKIIYSDSELEFYLIECFLAD